jgi:uncharacterized Zn-finger protein
MHRELTTIENLTVSLTALYNIAAGEQTDKMLLKKKRIENDREAGQLIASPDEHASAERADPHSPAPSPCSTEATIPQVEIEDPVLPSQQSSSSLMCNCPECNNQFSCMKVLNRHRKTCGRTLKFSCSQCDKIFAQKNSLNRHEKTHSSEKMWACEHHNCGKFFALKEYLDAHMKTHLSLECSNKKDLVEPVTPSDILA